MSAIFPASLPCMSQATVAGPETEPKIFVGQTPGQIIQPRGQTTFEWDPVFLPDGYDQTYAELDKAVKNKISHRYVRNVSCLHEVCLVTVPSYRWCQSKT